LTLESETIILSPVNEVPSEGGQNWLKGSNHFSLITSENQTNSPS
jgi:hypothetical protein